MAVSRSASGIQGAFAAVSFHFIMKFAELKANKPMPPPAAAWVY
jgi:hypothetical protein